jgi:hypothetical protein
MSKSVEGKLCIGVTLGLRNEDESLWVNGIKQNAIYLVDALQHCANVASVVLVNTTDIDPRRLPWANPRWPVISLQQALQTPQALDVLIELGGQVGANETALLKEKGTRLVSYCCGVEYIQAMESMLFQRPLWGPNLFLNPRYDAVWVIPQVAPSSAGFFSALRRCPTETVPFVWDPVFLQQRAGEHANAGEFQSFEGPARISIMEPNMDVVKFCLYPILIAEETYRRRPDLVEIMYVTNAKKLAETNLEFIGLMNHLDLVRQHKAVFLDRYDTPTFLAQMTDVVVSHQWGNPLNYFYLEVCWQGYPLVHNAALCQDLGYYYPDNDVVAGSQLLEQVLQSHSHHAQAYRTRQRELLARYRPGAPALTARYSALLQGLMQRTLR